MCVRGGDLVVVEMSCRLGLPLHRVWGWGGVGLAGFGWVCGWAHYQGSVQADWPGRLSREEARAWSALRAHLLATRTSAACSAAQPKIPRPFPLLASAILLLAIPGSHAPPRSPPLPHTPPACPPAPLRSAPRTQTAPAPGTAQPPGPAGGDAGRVGWREIGVPIWNFLPGRCDCYAHIHPSAPSASPVTTARTGRLGQCPWIWRCLPRSWQQGPPGKSGQARPPPPSPIASLACGSGAPSQVKSSPTLSLRQSATEQGLVGRSPPRPAALVQQGWGGEERGAQRVMVPR